MSFNEASQRASEPIRVLRASAVRTLASMLILAAGIPAAHADDPTIDESAASWRSLTTRAQVEEAWSLSRSDPAARFWLLSFNPLKYFHSTVSRGEVRCQVLQPSAAADIASLSSESYGGRAYGRPLPTPSDLGDDHICTEEP